VGSAINHVILSALIVSIVSVSNAEEQAKSLKEATMNPINESKGYKIRRSSDRGFFDHGWLKTYHTFSFADYYDPQFMGFRSLRVINEDTVSPGKGFPTHGHDNMEIITILLNGELAHKDSLENEKIIHEHEIQAMSAGTGVHHSEYNPSNVNISHFLQIWIVPDEQGIKPRYQQRSLPQKENEWILLASKTGEENSLRVQQDVKLYILSLSAKHTIEKTLNSHRYGWLQIMSGNVKFNGELLDAGDGVQLDPGTKIELLAVNPAKILFFDLN